MHRCKFLLVLLLMLLISTTTIAQIPRTLSYQGILTDNAGKPRPDQDYQFTFCLYDTAIGGSPLWTEQKTLSVKGGLFSTVLGDLKPFGAAVKFDKQYWLWIQVGNETELAPRIRLTSVGYSLSAVRADTAKLAVASLADTIWQHEGASIYRLNGNVGIGNSNPQKNLDILGNTRASGSWVNYTWTRSAEHEFAGGAGAGIKTFSITSKNYNAGTTLEVFRDNNSADNPGIVFEARSSGAGGFVVLGNGNTRASGSWIDYGWTRNAEHEFAGGAGAGVKTFSITSKNYNAGTTLEVFRDNNPANDPGTVFEARSSGAEGLIVLGNGNVGIGTTNPTSILDVAGRTKTQVLEITGGSDLAEPFEISHTDSLPVGSLVVIDPEQPGKLKQATEPYDKRVAGVISGAGGINPGLTLTQEGKLTGSQHVALTGKVYALATAANGAIELGDLLTTSSTPGHAMKATDKELWPGAVIGKAMSGLKEGEGLVLVLVNLQ